MPKKAVLFSIKPKYCELIASGKKTVEVRKTRPKIPTPFKGYIYCTVPSQKYLHRCTDSENEWYIDREPFCDGQIYGGKVIGEFVCDYISMNIKGYNQDGVPAYWNLLNGSCLTADELDDYGRGRPLYGLHISDLKIYDKPKELSEFRTICNYRNDDGSCQYDKVECDCCKFYFNSDFSVNLAECLNYMQRPPQSWCYVEDKK